MHLPFTVGGEEAEEGGGGGRPPYDLMHLPFYGGALSTFGSVPGSPEPQGMQPGYERATG